MLKKVKCPNCGTNTTVNTEKHVYRPKYCRECKSPIDNFHPKLRVLSVFQRNKEERHKQTRERFIQRMLFKHVPLRRMLKMLDGPEFPKSNVRKNVE